LRLGRQGWMTAGENQTQPVVFEILMFIPERRAGSRGVELFGQLHKRCIGTGTLAQRIDRLESSGGNEPGSRVARHAIAWPAPDRREEGFMQGFLGEFEVAKQTNKCGEDAQGLGA